MSGGTTSDEGMSPYTKRMHYMAQTNHIIRLMAAMSIAGMSLTSCIYEDEGVGTESTIGVNTTVVHDSRSPRDIANEEDPFTIQFWLPAQANQLADPDNLTCWQ